VTLIEAAERILGRVAAAETADYFRALHRAKGVDLREATQLTALSGNPHIKRAHLSDSDVLDVDFVVAGIGAVASDDLARDAGLSVDNGIAVDEHCRSSDERILAAGDCTSFICGGTRLRLESVQNAIEQGEAVAATLAGSSAGRKFSPWFWSDQYDTKLQIAGVSQGYDKVVRRPAKREGAQSIWYLKAERLIAVDAINDPVSYMTGRRLIDAGVTPTPEEIADPAISLVKLVPQAASRSS
jgi:3-phenylpropionate/trans-cinnamate dioxygenase ferredoxin reductase subunit